MIDAQTDPIDLRFVDIQCLSEALGIPVRTIRTLQHQRKIPVIRAGHRTNFFNIEKVRAALQKLEVKAIA